VSSNAIVEIDAERGTPRLLFAFFDEKKLDFQGV